ncbi:MAG: type I methionyl aminopeptidase [Abditibacteriota bacterium]|nr:type I methionyl aminopeptidase [Abditibacteriota bacterium]
MVIKKTPRELDRQRSACRVVARVLQYAGEVLRPGMTTLELDRLIDAKCAELGAVPSFKGLYGFPGAACISVNDELIHGIPSDRKVLAEGDIVSVDFGACKNGYHGDSTVTFVAGGPDKASEEAARLLDVTRNALMIGVKNAFPGNRLGDLGSAIEEYVTGMGCSVVREYVGHGIGRSVHEDPSVPNYGVPGKGLRLSEGVVLAIEPMVNAGSPAIRVLDNKWTVVTRDGALCAHFEHTVAITKNGPEILTKL